MNLETVLKLIDAGFTRAEILQMQGQQPETPPAPEQPDPETPPAPEQPDPETPPVAEQPDPETPPAPEQPDTSEFAALRKELAALRADLHYANIMHSGGGDPPKDIASEIAEQWSADPYPNDKH